MFPPSPARDCDSHHSYRSTSVTRVRLDTLLSQRGVFPSRTRAAASVLAGDVLLLPERRRAEKPGQMVRDDIELEVGASTGGFTDCLLQHGAAHVVAVDVAYGELNWRLRSDPRVTVIERRNA